MGVTRVTVVGVTCVTCVMGHCDTGHRTAVELRAAVEDKVGLGPLQLDSFGDLTIQGPLVGADNLALEHEHVITYQFFE